MIGHRRLGLWVGMIALVAFSGCMSKNASTQNGDGSGDQPYGGVKIPVQPNDSSFGTNQDSTGTDSTGLAPANDDGSPLPGTVNSDGSPIGASFLSFPTPGQIPFDLLPGFNPRTPTFTNSNVLKYFFCIGLTPPYNQGIQVLQLLDKYNLLTAMALKTAARLLTPSELRTLLRTISNVDDPASRSAAAHRLTTGDMSDDHLNLEIQSVYQTFLNNRSANADELAYWKNRLRNGTTYVQFVTEVSASPERIGYLGGRTVGQKISLFIQAQYKALLGRDVSQKKVQQGAYRRSELDNWLIYVNNRRRANRTWVQALHDATELLLSQDEYLGDIATKAAKLILEDKWASQVQSGLNRLKTNHGDLYAVKDYYFGTQEFYDKFRRFFVQGLTQDWCNQNATGFLQQWLGGGNGG